MKIRKEQKPGLFIPTIDRTRCEGGYHSACGSAKSPCVPACPYSVLEIHSLTVEDKRLLSLLARFRAWVHGNRQGVRGQVRWLHCLRALRQGVPNEERHQAKTPDLGVSDRHGWLEEPW